MPGSSSSRFDYGLAVARFVIVIVAAIAIGGPEVLSSTQTGTGIETAVLKGVLAGLVAYMGMVLINKALHGFGTDSDGPGEPSADEREIDTPTGRR